MASIRFDASLEKQIEMKYRLWANSRPRRPGQLGGAIWASVKGNVHPIDNTLDMQFPDAFVDELEDSEIPFQRCSS
jgi:hypothetical protein